MNYTNCWLNYHIISEKNKDKIKVYVPFQNEIIENAIMELKIGLEKLYHMELILVDDWNQLDGYYIQFLIDEEMKNQEEHNHKESYKLDFQDGRGSIIGSSAKSILYGVFSLLRYIQMNQVEDFKKLGFHESKEASNPIRMLNHWDNMDGSIERGYSGNSFFFNNHEILLAEEEDIERIRTYARMIASIQINAVSINNVNVKGSATELISHRYYDRLNRMSNIFASYGISMYLSINFAAPIELGGLDTSDPLDEKVIKWWSEKSAEVYEFLPKLGGYLVKADSEGRPGPFTYGRSHAEGANMLASSINRYDGLVIWRCFVYNCKQDWRDKETDRARAGYDNFMPIDGHFADNVILQIKNGPMDFQVREAISPLFGGLKKTNMMLEVQIAQEYTGQQRHVCYLLPWFKEILQFNTYCSEESGSIADIISGKTYNNVNCGMVAVTNTGNDENWTGHDLAAANLYGFGRLSFDTSLSSEQIACEWINQTFGISQKILENILKILMMSWSTYEKYTSPLGIGWMVKANHHYGPDVDGYEYDRWGTYHRADHKGIGVDRTENGTGYCKQYNEPLASIYAKRETCPEELLLFFHHVEYEYILSTGKTVIQHIYDTHFEGAKEAELFVDLFKELKELIHSRLYDRIVARLEHQEEHAKEWCDVINSYFYRKTGIKDRLEREIF